MILKRRNEEAEKAAAAATAAAAAPAAATAAAAVETTEAPAIRKPATAAAPAYIPKFRFCRFDAAVMILVVLLAAGVALQLYRTAQSSITADSHLETVLTVSGTEVWRINLADSTAQQTYKVTVDAGSLTVLAQNGKVCISASDCPDQICVHTGWLSSAGQTAVCLPFKVVLKVVSVNAQGSITQDTSALYDAISK